MSDPVSPATLKVLEAYHRKVKNQILKLKEQEDWKRYCTDNNISLKPDKKQHDSTQRANSGVALPRKQVTFGKTRRVNRKTFGTPTSYSVKSLKEQIQVYYRELERLEGESSLEVKKETVSHPSEGKTFLKTNVGKSQSEQLPASCEAGALEAEPNAHISASQGKFKVMLNAEPNQRFNIVKKERVFGRPCVTSNPTDSQSTCVRPQVSNDTAALQSSEKPVDSRPAILLSLSQSLVSDVENYRKEYEGHWRWKRTFVNEEVKNPWALVDSVSEDILQAAMDAVIQELELIFGSVVNELLEQEFAEQLA